MRSPGGIFAFSFSFRPQSSWALLPVAVHTHRLQISYAAVGPASALWNNVVDICLVEVVVATTFHASIPAIVVGPAIWVLLAEGYAVFRGAATALARHLHAVNSSVGKVHLPQNGNIHRRAQASHKPAAGACSRTAAHLAAHLPVPVSVLYTCANYLADICLF